MTRIGTTVEAEGMRELRKKLRRMDNGMDNLKGLHLDLAEIVANRAEALAPVRTGRLKQSIRPSGTQTAGRVRAGYKRVPWTGPVHFGWATRPDAAKGWRGGPIHPNPFLYDALDERHNQVFKTYFEGIKKIQRKAGL
jgi:hypothetical protein